MDKQKSNEWFCVLAELIRAVKGRALSEPHEKFYGVGTDTRKDLSGLLFVPLKGENFDAHAFVEKAVERGAAVILISEWREQWRPLLEKASFVQVHDTLRAFQDFARYWRRKHDFKTLAITGSNGKTSTKEYAYVLLKDHYLTHASKGSLNNHWGVPMSILSAAPATEVLILEMGMNHSGEIRRLCEIAEPDVVVVTTVGTGHIGELGSQEAVAAAKEEIYQTSPSAVQVFNMDNKWTQAMQKRSDAAKILFSAQDPTADVYFETVTPTESGLEIRGQIRTVAGHIKVAVWGRHNAVNLMAAAGLALATGMPAERVWSELGNLHASAWGRNQVLELKNGARVLFDAYNSNPDSLKALLDNLSEAKKTGRRFFVMGEMRELGAMSEHAHEEAGERAGRLNFDGIWFVGKFSDDFERGLKKSQQVPPFFWRSEKVNDELAKQLFDFLQPGDLVVLKGSRGMELEHAIEKWPTTVPFAKKS